MLSAKQLLANQLNAQKSTGPRTAEGKQKSSRNSMKHGLTGQAFAHHDFQTEAYAEYSESMLVDLAPGNTIELDLARRIIHDSWRLNRAGAMDENLLADTIATSREDEGLVLGEHAVDYALAQARAFRDQAKTFNLLSLYEQRLQRAVLKNLAALKAMQKERLSAPKSQPVKAAAASAMPPQPIAMSAGSRENGFVYSSTPRDPAPPPESVENASENMAA